MKEQNVLLGANETKQKNTCQNDTHPSEKGYDSFSSQQNRKQRDGRYDGDEQKGLNVRKMQRE